jgi:uncharacterized protein
MYHAPLPSHALPFDQEATLAGLHTHLPSQAALKDFIHHNPLHGFQHLPFGEAMEQASAVFGYEPYLPLDAYRERYAAGEISPAALADAIQARHGSGPIEAQWRQWLISSPSSAPTAARIGQLRAGWKAHFQIDLDSRVHPLLFRILCGFLDQGVAIWRFPGAEAPFLEAIRAMEAGATTSWFRTKRPRALLAQRDVGLGELLSILVGDERLYAQYLFDQQFAHPGWSGLVAVVERQPGTLLDTRMIRLADAVLLECLLEIDALDHHFPGGWQPLAHRLAGPPVALAARVDGSGALEVRAIWQDALERSYHDPALAAMAMVGQRGEQAPSPVSSFQAMFCIDERESSLRSYLEQSEPSCQTFGTPGFFGIDAYYQPLGGHFLEKICPAPVSPKHLLRDRPTGHSRASRNRELHLHKDSYSFHSGLVFSQIIGFWSALRLAFDVFRPSSRPAGASSFAHMEKAHALEVAHREGSPLQEGLQVGYRVEEMSNRVGSLLRSIGLVRDFAPLVYVVGHGASSVNNPHYSAYDCGACSGRAGSVNSRAICDMANRPAVRALLRADGIDIPAETQFVGALHDTTLDDIEYYDASQLSEGNVARHRANVEAFKRSLGWNAKERSRRFSSTHTQQSIEGVHRAVRRRAISLFEPRPELNHATNALCIVGRRALTKPLFLDRRAFLNSYDYRLDPSGDLLLGILRPVAPVCGGINLEYYFSRVDNLRLGAGTKLPHNVMGLVGVANGSDGDLRPGLPTQMIEVHDPLRLLVVVEHRPDFILATLQRSPETLAWFAQGWIHLASIDPESGAIHRFDGSTFCPYTPFTQAIASTGPLDRLIERTSGNIPILQLP